MWTVMIQDNNNKKYKNKNNLKNYKNKIFIIITTKKNNLKKSKTNKFPSNHQQQTRFLFF